MQRPLPRASATRPLGHLEQQHVRALGLARRQPQRPLAAELKRITERTRSLIDDMYRSMRRSSTYLGRKIIILNTLY